MGAVKNRLADASIRSNLRAISLLTGNFAGKLQVFRFERTESNKKIAVPA